MASPRPIQIAQIDTARCTGCGWCVASCPLHLLSLQARGWQKFSTLQEAGLCTGCRLCEARCPFGAITLRLPGATPPGQEAQPR